MALVGGENAPKAPSAPSEASPPGDPARTVGHHALWMPGGKILAFSARAQIELSGGGRTALATLYQSADGLVDLDQVGLSEVVWRRLGLSESDEIKVRHPRPLHSMSAMTDSMLNPERRSAPSSK